MTQSKVEQAKSRVMAIDWEKRDWLKTGSNLLLFKEFLRRVVLAAEAIGLFKGTGAGWLMGNHAAFFNPSLELEAEEIDELAEELQIPDVYTSWYVKRFCIYYIHWAMVEDYPEVQQHNLLNPYEPLIILYERGGRFRRDKDGTWEIDSLGYCIQRPSYYLQASPFTELYNEELLDQIDKDFANS
jgi:hypothetical protein